MKKILSFMIILLIAVGAFCGFRYHQVNTPTLVGILPLDSRPCNTQYVEQLGKMANIDVAFPEDELLDQFLTPSDPEPLWDWLDGKAKEVDHLIISTNQLFNGGLLNSRNSESYHQVEENLSQFAQFCEENKDVEITVITILPRLLPSQFDKVLWEHREVLVSWGKELDCADLNQQPLPEAPDLPKEIIEDYSSIYSHSGTIVKTVGEMAKTGLIDHYIVGQDDAEDFGPSNMIVRHLRPTFSTNVSVLHGADELTMLALGDYMDYNHRQGVNIVYTNPELRETVFPYESLPLYQVIEQKLSFLGIPIDEQSSNLLIVHNDVTKWPRVETLLPEDKTGYIGIIDIAYTNRGDIKLFDLVTNKENLDLIDGYAGWNTASNAIGTEVAHMYFYNLLEKNSLFASKKTKEKALTGFMEFKYTRLAEDFLYQGILKDQLVQEMYRYGFIYPHMALTEAYHNIANAMVQQLYEPYQESLSMMFEGKHKFGNGFIEQEFVIDDFSSSIVLPWQRIFEIKANCDFKLQCS